MKNRNLFLIFFACIILFFLCVFILIYNSSKITGKFLSPLPFFSENVLSAQISREIWKPNIESIYDGGIKEPELTALSALSYDLTSENILYGKNIKERLPIASLTKIMTAIIALENEDPDKIVSISRTAANIGENSMGLSEGEILTVRDLLYGLILPSGNDAAEALAEANERGRDNFLYLMNKKVRDLGLTDTNFTNPSGLEGDGTQYSTAYDLLVIAQYGLKNAEFRKLVSTPRYSISYSSRHKAFELFNDTNLLTSYPGVKGIKTGFTDEAGLCLVTYLDYEGHEIVAVLLNSQNRRQEMKDLLDYSLRSLGIKLPEHQ